MLNRVASMDNNNRSEEVSVWDFNDIGKSLVLLLVSKEYVNLKARCEAVYEGLSGKHFGFCQDAATSNGSWRSTETQS